MVELNTPYSAKELCEKLFNISYNSFRKKDIKEKYLNKLSECYEWEKVKTKYVLTAKKKEWEKKKKSDVIFNESYLPMVVENIGDGKWTTGTGVAVEIFEKNNDYIVNTLGHAYSSTYNYTLRALKEDFTVCGKRYAKGYWKGYYGEGPDFMTDEEIAAWNELKKSEYANVGKKIIELTEDWMGKGYSSEEFKNKVGKIASESFANILMDWITTKGYVPVMLGYYEPLEIGIDFSPEDDKYEW